MDDGTTHLLLGSLPAAFAFFAVGVLLLALLRFDRRLLGAGAAAVVMAGVLSVGGWMSGLAEGWGQSRVHGILGLLAVLAAAMNALLAVWVVLRLGRGIGRYVTRVGVLLLWTGLSAHLLGWVALNGLLIGPAEEEAPQQIRWEHPPDRTIH